MESWMSDLDAAWWAKLRRANTHLETLAKLVDDFAATEPYTLDPEPGEGVVAYRLHIRREAPAEISTVVGDVLHNLRSALDSVAYELAVQAKGEALTGRLMIYDALSAETRTVRVGADPECPVCGAG